MAADLIIAPEAARDLDGAYDWYESHRVGQGDDFLNRVDACIQAIRRFPESHAPLHGTYRRALVRKYPYAIFYEYAEGSITIYCVFHTSQDPRKWLRRLP